MKILIANPHLKVGGIASSLMNWIEYLKRKEGYDVTLVIFDTEIDSKYISILNDIDVIVLNRFEKYRLNHKRFRTYSIKYRLYFILMFVLRKCNLSNSFIKKIFKKYKFDGEYDVAISYSNDIPYRKDNVLCNDFVLYSVHAKKKIAWIHNDINRLGFTAKYIKRRFLKFDYIVNVANSCKKQLDQLFPNFKNKSVVISNPIDFSSINKKSNIDNKIKINEGIYNFVTVARIAKQKRIDRLIDVATILHAKGLDFNWYVLGGGNELEFFKNELKKRGLEKKVFFKGFVNDPYIYIKSCDFFILTSDYEAQPVSVLEALLLSIPVVSTDIPIMKEFIVKGKNGFITKKNSEDIANILAKIIKNKISLKGFTFEYDKFKSEFNDLIIKCTYNNDSSINKSI